jgi:MATE family multidrug resistance protein
VVLAFSTAAAAGMAAAIVLEAAAGPITAALGAQGSVQEGAVTYVRIRALAAPAVLAVRAGHGTYRGFQDTRTPLWLTLGINGVNLALDPLLIFGLGWGIAGAAWATTIAQWLGAAGFLALILGRHRDRLSVVPARPNLGELRAFLRVGRDLVIRSGSLLAVLTLASAVATRVSDAAIAAHQVVMQIWLLLSLALDALAIAAQALVGRLLGERRRRDAAAVSDRLLVVGVAVGALFLGLLAAGSPFVPGWFTDDDGVVSAIGSIWPLLLLAQPLNAAVFVWDGVFIGAGDFAYLAGATAAASVAAAVVLAAVLPAGWGLAGVWWGMTVMVAARALTLAWRRVAPGGPLRPPPAPDPSSRERV